MVGRGDGRCGKNEDLEGKKFKGGKKNEEKALNASFWL